MQYISPSNSSKSVARRVGTFTPIEMSHVAKIKDQQCVQFMKVLRGNVTAKKRSRLIATIVSTETTIAISITKGTIQQNIDPSRPKTSHLYPNKHVFFLIYWLMSSLRLLSGFQIQNKCYVGNMANLKLFSSTVWLLRLLENFEFNTKLLRNELAYRILLTHVLQWLIHPLNERLKILVWTKQDVAEQ